MISILDKNSKISEHKSSLNITYPRTVNIIFGNYPYPEVLHNLIIEIKNNVKEHMNGYTNVKGGMTEWSYFVDNPLFKNFFAHLINKHQITHGDIFQFFYEKFMLQDVWGNEIKKGDSLEYHTHPCYHGIFYLTKGCDLILPELNLKISPEPGDYYIFPPHILHGFEPVKEEETRYSLIFNILENKPFEFSKKVRTLNEKNS